MALVVIGFLLLVRYTTHTSSTVAQHRRDVRVDIVIDGDTIQTDTGERVRLRGIDSPEVAHHDQKLQHFGNESTQWLTQQIEGKVVTLVIDADEDVDRYGRTLAWIYLADGTLINLESIATGHARLMDRFGLPFDLEPALRQAAADAKSAQRGLWKQR